MSNYPKSFQKKNNNPPQTATTSVQQKAWSGPIPPPEALEKFATIDSRIPMEIVTMARHEMENRHKIDDANIFLAKKDRELAQNLNNNDFWDKQIGRLYVLMVMVMIITPTIYAGLEKQQPNAWYALLGELVIFASAAIYSQIKSKEKNK